MNQELQIGKYEFYPYPGEDFKDAPSLEELLEFLKSPAKAKSEKDDKTPSQFSGRSQPRRKRRSYVPRNAGSLVNANLFIHSNGICGNDQTRNRDKICQ